MPYLPQLPTLHLQPVLLSTIASHKSRTPQRLFPSLQHLRIPACFRRAGYAARCEAWQVLREPVDPRTMDDFSSGADESTARMLGPQQSRKPTTPRSTDSKPASWQADPKALLDPTAASTKNSYATTNSTQQSNGQHTKVPDHQNPSEEPNGMSDMLFNLHGVSNREAPPAKRRKVDKTEDDKPEDEDHRSKSTFTGEASNGILGDHIREERKKAAAASDDIPQTIDITGDDDDDVQIIGSRSKEDTTRVCLGMLHAQANVHHIPRHPRAQQNILGKDMYPQIRVNYKRIHDSSTIIDLFDRSPNGDRVANKFGKMEVKVAAALCPLLDMFTVNGMEIKVYLNGMRKRAGEFEGARVSRGEQLRVVVYAPKSKAVGIGKVLSHKDLWFETPVAVPVDRGVELFNPHAPQSYGAKLQSSSKRLQNAQPTYGVSRTQEEMVRETNSMIDNLITSNEIPEMEADPAAIKTELKKLQKQALHFMTQHERDSNIDHAQISLWKQRETTKGTVWAHVITNHEVARRPEPARGGVLADMMGLGKTLSILSLHASTREEGKQFGDDEPPMEPESIVRNAKATLIVCPKSVLTNWVQQIREHTYTRHFKVYSYHGPSRTQDLDELASYDIVLAPYGTVASEYALPNGLRTALASVNWFRIVLDEAHSIRTVSTQTSKACCALTAQRRWAVTGTPVQNKLDDLGTLIKFLRVKPFDDETSWAKHIMAPLKTADENVVQHLQLLVASITLRRTKDQVGLPRRDELQVKLQFSAEERAMYAQFSGQANLQVRAMTRDKGRIQGKGYAFMLRSIHRLRAICAHGQEMLSDDDMKELEGLTAQTAIDLGDEPDGEPDSSFITEAQAYDFLHMMVESESDICTGCAKKITKKDEEEKEPKAGNTESSDEETDESESDESAKGELDSETEGTSDVLGYINPCYDHLICPECKDKYISDAQQGQRTDGYHNCPYCDQYVRFGLFQLRRSALQSFLEAKAPKNKKQRTKWDESTYSGPHTKVKALIDDLKQSATESSKLGPGEPPIKSVIFSGWTTYLDLIEYALDEHSIKYNRLDGTMSVKQRTAVLDEFKSDDDIIVILVSIKAGGQGLNLTSASKVYMMEPQFNPGVEQQAIDRVHRLGQTRDVEIKHFIMEESIEEKIQKMQERKQELARLAMEKKLSRGEAAKKRIEDLRELFK